MIVANAALLFVLSAAPVQATTTATDAIVQRVLVVADEPSDRWPRRVADELSALGFDVVLRDDDDVIDVREAAAFVHAAVAIELRGARVDLWADLHRRDGTAAHAALAAPVSDEDPDEIGIAAVRIAELVRARLLGPRGAVVDVDADAVAAAPAGSMTPTPQRTPTSPLRFSVAAAPSLALAGEAPAQLGATVHGSALINGNIDVGVRVALPVLPTQLSAADPRNGTAELWPTDALLVASMMIPLDATNQVTTSIGAAAGARWIHGRGVAANGAVKEGDLFGAVVAADAQLRWRLSGALSLWADVTAGAIVPRPIVVVGDAETIAGPAFASAALGLALTFPEDEP